MGEFPLFSASRAETRLCVLAGLQGDGTEFVALEQPYAAGQTLRVLTHWEQRSTK